jgi:hypothetical protein
MVEENTVKMMSSNQRNLSKKANPNMSLLEAQMKKKKKLLSKFSNLKRLLSKLLRRWLSRVSLMMTSSHHCDLEKLLLSDQHWINLCKVLTPY